MIWKPCVFLAASALLLVLSRASLLHPRSHGFWRFFAWEAIVALSLLHVDRWFATPFAWHQLVSWALLALCCVPVVWGTVLLRRQGRQARERAGDPTLLAFERTTVLVTSGVYRYIRHPLYTSLLLLAWGIFFKGPSWMGGSLSAAATAFLVATALADEAECRRFFGPEYATYMRRTTRFIPFVV